MIEEGASDCGGLSGIFVAALRAQGIAARWVVGRWTQVDRDAETQYHVRAEFFAEGVGWVPVDGSGAVVWNGAPAAAFGRHEPNFLVMHVDLDLDVDTRIFGRKQVRWLQTPVFWVRGKGTVDNGSESSVYRVRAVVPAAAR